MNTNYCWDMRWGPASVASDIDRSCETARDTITWLWSMRSKAHKQTHQDQGKDLILIYLESRPMKTIWQCLQPPTSNQGLQPRRLWVISRIKSSHQFERYLWALRWRRFKRSRKTQNNVSAGCWPGRMQVSRFRYGHSYALNTWVMDGGKRSCFVAK